MRDKQTAGLIAKVASRILEREGPQAVTMRRVAHAVGITPMAIYHHFADRESLLNAITNQEFDRLLAYIQAHPLRGSPTMRVITVMEGYLDYAFARPLVFDYVFSKRRPGARRFPEDFRARRSPTLNPVADTLASAMKEGALRKGDVWELAFGLWAHVHGYVVLYRAGRIHLSEQKFRELVRRSIRRFIHGLKD